jgi:phosphatidylserine synthase 2
VFSVPPSNILNIVRLGLWFGIANVATREYFVFITSSRGMRTTKLGSNAWLAIAVALVEVLVTVKHGRDMFTAPWPRRVVVFWSVVGSAVAGWLVHWQLRLNRHRSFVREKRE